MISEPGAGRSRPETNDDAAASSVATAPTRAFMYVHYLTRLHSSYYPVYLFQLTATEDLKTQIKRAIDEIIAGDAHQVKPLNARVEWRVPSYTVFVLNDVGQRLTGVDFSADGKSHPGFDKEGDFDGYRNCSIVYYLNKRQNKNGGNLGNNKEVVNWKAMHETIAAVEVRTVTHDSSTTNTGP